MGTLPGRGEHLIHHFMVPLPLFAAQALQGKACETPLRHGAKASLRIVGAAVCLVLLPLYTSSRLCKTRLWSTKIRDVILLRLFQTIFRSLFSTFVCPSRNKPSQKVSGKTARASIQPLLSMKRWEDTFSLDEAKSKSDQRTPHECQIELSNTNQWPKKVLPPIPYNQAVVNCLLRINTYPSDRG